MKYHTQDIPDDFAFSEGGSLQIGSGKNAVTVESSADRIVFMSDFEITRDADGLTSARQMAHILARAIAKLEGDQKSSDLPDKLSPSAPTIKGNPLQ